MADQKRNDPKASGTGDDSPIHQVDDKGGLRSSGPTSTTDKQQSSALGGDVSTRSGTADASGGMDTDGSGTGGMNSDKSAGSGPGYGGSSGV